VADTDIDRPGSRASKARDIEVFPAPEGEDRTSINPRRAITFGMASPSLDIRGLFAQTIDLRLEVEADPGEFEIRRL
jgi:hypothetical protein